MRLRYNDQMPADMAARANANLSRVDSMYARFNERARNVATYPTTPTVTSAQPSSFRWSLDQPVDTTLAAQPLLSVNGTSRSLFAPPTPTPQPQAQKDSTGLLPPTNPNAYNNRSTLYQPVTPQLRQQYGWGAFNYGE